MFSRLKSGMTFAGVFQKAGNVFVTSAIVLGFRFFSARRRLGMTASHSMSPLLGEGILRAATIKPRIEETQEEKRIS